LKHGVNGRTARVQRGNTCWRHNRKSLVRAFTKAAQESGFTGSRFAREKNVTACAIHKSRSRFHHFRCVQSRFHGAKKRRTHKVWEE